MQKLFAAPAPKKRVISKSAEKRHWEAAAKLAEEQATFCFVGFSKQLPVMDEPITDVPLEILQDIPAQPAETIDDATETAVLKSRKKRNLWHLLIGPFSADEKMIFVVVEVSHHPDRNGHGGKRI